MRKFSKRRRPEYINFSHFSSVDNSYVDINNDQGVRDIRNALESNGVDPSRYVGLDEEDMQTRTAEAIENQRLSDLVDAFESQCINVCRGFENRSRNPNLPSLSVDIDELATAIKEHILTVSVTYSIYMKIGSVTSRILSGTIVQPT